MWSGELEKREEETTLKAFTRQEFPVSRILCPRMVLALDAWLPFSPVPYRRLNDSFLNKLKDLKEKTNQYITLLEEPNKTFECYLICLCGLRALPSTHGKKSPDHLKSTLLLTKQNQNKMNSVLITFLVTKEQYSAPRI